MIRIYITFPLHGDTVKSLGFEEDKVIRLGESEVLYEPKIGQRQHWCQKDNLMYKAMEDGIENFKPDVIVIGNNRVPEAVLDRWNAVMNRYKTNSSITPMIIRRGIELGGIPVDKARDYGIQLSNIPAINSPYVARHMLEQLNFPQAQPGQVVAVLGAGDIGLPIIKAAVRQGLRVRVLSGATIDTDERRQQKIAEIREYLKANHLNADALSYPKTIDAVLLDADYVAISVPWWLKQQRHNVDMIDVRQLAGVAHGATIVSCSNPRVFTEEALRWMNEAMFYQCLAKVRIDTGHSYAKEVYERYKCKELDVKAGQAFYCNDCLIRLDRALLNVAYQHANISSHELLLKMPKPRDGMDIESYVVNPKTFFNTEYFNAYRINAITHPQKKHLSMV